MPKGKDSFSETKKGELLTYNVSDQVDEVTGNYDMLDRRLVTADVAATNERAVKYATGASLSYTGFTYTNSGGANLGEPVTVQVTGVAEGIAGGTIAFGDPLKGTTGGKLLKAVQGDLAVGTAEQDSVVDETVSVKINQHTVA